MKNDGDIIDGIKKRDEKAFGLLVDRYGGLIRSIISYHLQSFKSEQEECVNDVLLAIWQNISSYDEQKNSLKNWIGAICKYKAIDCKRKYHAHLSYDELDDNLPSAKDALLEAEIEAEIESILSCLDSEDRQIFYRHYILGEKIAEISKSTEKSPGFLFNRLSRGRNKIRKTFKEVIYK